MSARPTSSRDPARFKAYPTYKESGVEWLGEIPAHWRVRRLKHLSSLNPKSLAEDTDPNLELVYVDIGGVDSLGRIVERESLTFASAPSRARRLVRGGDVIVSTVRTYLRAIASIKTPAPNLVVSTGFAVVRPAEDLTADYAAYALRAPYFVERVVANSKGVSFPAINESEMATYGLAVPPIDEQRAIAAFLDGETEKIDALVSKKERVIELLQEKRAALITQAVAKGLEPDVAMKDSGVEWLGKIPAHWEVWHLRRVIKRFVDYRGQTPEKTPSGVPLITARNIKNQRIDLSVSEEFIADDVYERWMVRGVPERGDVVVTTEAPLGESAQIDDCNIALAQRVILLKADKAKVTNDYLKYHFAAGCGSAELWSKATGSTALGIKASHLRATLVAIPPVAEQCEITQYLDRETAKIDALSGRIHDAITGLKELRTALISAAVTGKIDVRDEIV